MVGNGLQLRFLCRSTANQTLRGARRHRGMVVPWVWGTAKQGPHPHSAPSRMALSNGVKGVLSVACFPRGAFLLWVGIFSSFLGVAGVQTWELDVVGGDGDDAAVSCTWLSPTKLLRVQWPLTAERSIPIITGSILARWNAARGAQSGAHHQHLAPGRESASSQLCGARHRCICFPSIS